MSNNKQILSTKKDELISLYNQNMKDKVMTNEFYLSLLEVIVTVICYSSKDEPQSDKYIKSHLIEIFKHWVSFLDIAQGKLMSDTAVNISNDECNEIKNLLIVIKSISKGIYEGLNSEYSNIMTEIFNAIWPKLKVIFLKLPTNWDIIENLIQIVKYFMRGMKDNFKGFLEEYVKCIIEGYKITPISSYLYGFEVLLTVFAKDDSNRKIIDILFSEFFQFTFDNYLRSSIDLRENDQLGEDFFGLLGRIVKFNPFIIFDSSQCEKILKFSVDNIGTTEIEVSKNISLFLKRLINTKTSSPIQELPQEKKAKYIEINEKFVKEICDDMVKEILNTLLQAPPNQIVEELRDLLSVFIPLYLKEAIASFSCHLVNVPYDVLTKKEKEEFIKALMVYDKKNTFDDNGNYDPVEKVEHLLDKLSTRSENKYKRRHKGPL